MISFKIKIAEWLFCFWFGKKEKSLMFLEYNAYRLEDHKVKAPTIKPRTNTIARYFQLVFPLVIKI